MIYRKSDHQALDQIPVIMTETTAVSQFYFTIRKTL